MADPLFKVSNSFHCGAYQACVSAGLEDVPEAASTQRDVFVYRAHLALGSTNLVLSSIDDSAPSALQAVKLYATYTAAPEANLDAVLSGFDGLLSDPGVSLNPSVLLMAANVHARAGNAPEALRLCHAAPSNLELMALSVQILLSMDRPDAAEKAAKAMAALDDDATLSQLAGAYVSLALGGPKVVEAAYAFQEAGEKHGWTAKLHAGAAACFAAQGAWDEAERCLGEALACDGKDPDVLAGLIVACAQLGRRGGAKAKAYGLQLRAAAPAHPFITRGAAAEAAFEAAAAAITA